MWKAINSWYEPLSKEEEEANKKSAPIATMGLIAFLALLIFG